MKTSLDHLPENKRIALAAMTARILEVAPDADMIVLFGSHARGDWVRDVVTGYRSDYDLLIVVDGQRVDPEGAIWRKAEAAAREVAAPWSVTMIVHDVRQLNREIRRGQFFYTELWQQGIVLHDAQRFTLARPKAATQAERHELAQEYFDHWFVSAGEFFAHYEFACARKTNNIAAFQLHQATERYLAAFLLVFTGTKPKSHNLEELSTLVAPLHPLLAAPFPQTTKEEKDLFDLLKRAYIDSRYSKSYRITLEELGTLGGWVQDLAGRVDRACREKIATFVPEAS